MADTDDKITAAEPRQNVHVRFADGRIFSGPVGTTLQAFVRQAFSQDAHSVVAALVNGEVRELTYPIEGDVQVTPLDLTTGDGMRIYQRSLCFLMVVAAQELFPEARLVIDHSLTLSGLYCEVQERPPFTAEEIGQLEARMRELVAEDAPIGKERMPLDQAIEMFRQQGYEDKVRLLRYCQKDYLIVYTLHGVRDYFYGYMVPSTGYLRHFALHWYPPGWILRFPRRHDPHRLPPFRDSPKLARVFRDYRRSLQVMGVEDVSTLNEATESCRMHEVVLINEALHEHEISQIAQTVADHQGELRLVLLSGPSASGKTTTAKRLSVQLLAHGIHPLTLGLDDYFLDRDKTPRDADGHYQFEDLAALDLDLFNQQLLDLMAGRPTTLARYDFRAGKRVWGDVVQISPEHVIIVEGIHGLNPDLVPHIPRETIFRVYVSCLTQLNIDHHNRVPTTDTRLLRRIVRDAQSRGYTAQQTIRQWEFVRQGEERNIFPYQENADVMFNSALAYELAVLKPFAEPLLREIEPDTLEYAEAKRLLRFLEWFLPYGTEKVPNNSILREFVGGSVLEDFEPWRRGVCQPAVRRWE